MNIVDVRLKSPEHGKKGRKAPCGNYHEIRLGAADDEVVVKRIDHGEVLVHSNQQDRVDDDGRAEDGRQLGCNAKESVG